MPACWPRWEREQEAKDEKRVYGGEKRCADPRGEKVRGYRRFLKRNLENEAYGRAKNHEYRAGGHIT